jgi:hypothetical protein
MVVAEKARNCNSAEYSKANVRQTDFLTSVLPEFNRVR